jgi:hypothetical protein
LIIHYDWGFLITLYMCLMSYSFYRTRSLTFLHLFHNSNNIWWQVQLWSYIFCSFLQFLITFSHESLRNEEHCSQTQSTAFPQCYSQSVGPTFMKILGKHTHVCISNFMLAESRKESKFLWSYIEHYCKLISSQFLDSAIFIPKPKIFNFPKVTKFQAMYQLVHV